MSFPPPRLPNEPFLYPDPTTMGPIGFGTIFDLFLLGALTAQIYIYYLAFPNDRRWLKAAVSCVYSVCVVQTTFALIDLYAISHNTRTSPTATTEGTEAMDYATYVPKEHTWLTIVASSICVASIAQVLYAHRIYVISRKIWISTLIACLTLGQVGTGLVGIYCIDVHIPGILTGGRLDINGAGTVCTDEFNLSWGCLNIVCDAMIAICMVSLLLKRRSETLMSRTRTQVMNLVQIIIQTGTATSLFVIFFTILFVIYFWKPKDVAQLELLAVFKHQPWYFIPGLAMSKIHGNSMLALLNNRIAISSRRKEDNISESRRDVPFHIEIDRIGESSSAARAL